jgi:hypothetical protein
MELASRPIDEALFELAGESFECQQMKKRCEVFDELDFDV